MSNQRIQELTRDADKNRASAEDYIRQQLEDGVAYVILPNKKAELLVKISSRDPAG